MKLTERKEMNFYVDGRLVGWVWEASTGHAYGGGIKETALETYSRVSDNYEEALAAIREAINEAYS